MPPINGFDLAWTAAFLAPPTLAWACGHRRVAALYAALYLTGWVVVAGGLYLAVTR